MKLKYLLVTCAALFVSTQSLAAKPSDESAMKWLEIQGIGSNYSEKVQRSLEMVNKEDNERLLAMTPQSAKSADEGGHQPLYEKHARRFEPP